MISKVNTTDLILSKKEKKQCAIVQKNVQTRTNARVPTKNAKITQNAALA